jgi:hypothetical protein
LSFESCESSSELVAESALLHLYQCCANISSCSLIAKCIALIITLSCRHCRVCGTLVEVNRATAVFQGDRQIESATSVQCVAHPVRDVDSCSRIGHPLFLLQLPLGINCLSFCSCDADRAPRDRSLVQHLPNPPTPPPNPPSRSRVDTDIAAPNDRHALKSSKCAQVMTVDVHIARAEAHLTFGRPLLDLHPMSSFVETFVCRAEEVLPSSQKVERVKRSDRGNESRCE